MTYPLDLGARCDRHVGEAFRVRCAECDELNIPEQPVPRTGFFYGTECPIHPHYPISSAAGTCDRCERDAAITITQPEGDPSCR